MRRPRVSLITMVAFAVVLILDRLTKIWVVDNLPFQVPVTVIPGLESIFTFTYIHNRGAAFGLFPQAGAVFALVQLLVVVGLVIWYDRLPVQHFLVRLSIGMIQGGAIGNLIDRVTTGYVVDFLHLHFWPIFNVADSAVSVGVVILAFYLLSEDSAVAKSDDAEVMGPDGSACA